MKLPLFVVSALLASMLAVQGWTLLAVIDLKVKVAELSATVAAKK